MTRLRDRRVKIQIMRHHRRSKDADGNVEHFAIVQEFRGRKQAERHSAKIGPGQKDLDAKRDANDADQRYHQSLNQPEASLLEVKNGEDVAGRQANSPNQRETKEQV